MIFRDTMKTFIRKVKSKSGHTTINTKIIRKTVYVSCISKVNYISHIAKMSPQRIEILKRRRETDKDLIKLVAKIASQITQP